jgi:hypothetical protein
MSSVEYLFNVVTKKSDFGDGLFATNDIGIGETVLIEQPIIQQYEKLTFLKSVFRMIVYLVNNNNDFLLNLCPYSIDENDINDDDIIIGSYKHSLTTEYNEIIDELGMTFEIKTLKLYSLKIMRNCFGITNNSFGMTKTSFGLLFFGSKINHNCDPNMIHTIENNKIVFKLLRNVLEGEELCISYSNIGKKCLNTRQKLLKIHYGFDCICEKCKSEKNDYINMRNTNEIIMNNTINSNFKKTLMSN